MFFIYIDKIWAVKKKKTENTSSLQVIVSLSKPISALPSFYLNLSYLLHNV